jgi:hypothetical protein
MTCPLSILKLDPEKLDLRKKPPTNEKPTSLLFSAVGLEQILFDSAQRPRQTLIRVPVVMGGIVIVVWEVDGILENYSLGAGRHYNRVFDSWYRKK